MILPFQETKISDNTFIREFSQDTDSGEFMWHRDFESRIIESIGDTDWLGQEKRKRKKGARLDQTYFHIDDGRYFHASYFKKVSIKTFIRDYKLSQLGL